jgi:hypothetical protein
MSERTRRRSKVVVNPQNLASFRCEMNAFPLAPETTFTLYPVPSNVKQRDSAGDSEPRHCTGMNLALNPRLPLIHSFATLAMRTMAEQRKKR